LQWPDLGNKLLRYVLALTLRRRAPGPRRVKAAGDKLYLDIHYSDFWADPTHQDTPAAWQGQDLSGLTTTVQFYTAQVIGAFAAQGTPVDMVSIGNEIRNGILWPVGEVDWSTDTGWDNLTTLLKAGVAGARAANPPGHKWGCSRTRWRSAPATTRRRCHARCPTAQRPR